VLSAGGRRGRALPWTRIEFLTVHLDKTLPKFKKIVIVTVGQKLPAYMSSSRSLDGRIKANAAIVPAGTGLTRSSLSALLQPLPQLKAAKTSSSMHNVLSNGYRVAIEL